MAALQNWAGNYTYSAARVHRPATVAELQELVAGSRKLRVLGSRHSFNAIADTPEDLVSLERLQGPPVLDRGRRTVTVEAGVRYGELCRWLDAEGFALHNLASLPHISVAGACATATHGSGDRNGNLATAVAALELVSPDGELIVLSREADGELFRGAVVGLGSVGVVTRVSLDVEPAYAVRQTMYEGLALDRLEAHFDAIMARGYSVSVFTDWRVARTTQVLVKRRVAPGESGEVEPELFGAGLATARRHPIVGLPADNCTEQLDIPGPWHERLPHFRLEFTPSAGEELQSEYFVPRARAAEAIRAMRGIDDALAPQLQISELRTIAADNLWMSPAYGRDTLGIHFTWVKDWPAVRALLPLVEERLAPFGARPHWGKLFAVGPAELAARFERLGDFRALLARFDPQGKLRNPFVEACLFGAR